MLFYVLGCVSIPIFLFVAFNTSYLTDSYIGFTLKMESVSINTIFGLKMMVKSGLEIFLEIPPCRKIVIFITGFVIFGSERNS